MILQIDYFLLTHYNSTLSLFDFRKDIKRISLSSFDIVLFFFPLSSQFSKVWFETMLVLFDK